MDRHVFAKNVIVTNADGRRSAAVFKVLRGFADDASGEEAISGANARQPGEIDMRPDHAPWAEFHAFVDHRKGADFDRGIEPGFGMNYGGRMNHAGKVRERAALPSQKYGRGQWLTTARWDSEHGEDHAPPPDTLPPSGHRHLCGVLAGAARGIS